MTTSHLEKDKFIFMKLNTVFTLKREKRYQEAERILSELLDEYGDNLSIQKSMADLMVKQNKLANALLLIDKVLSLSPQDTEAMIIKGYIYYKKKKYREAKEWFQSAVQHKGSKFALHMLIKTMIQLDELEEAHNLTVETLQRDSDDVYLFQLKAEILEARDKIDEAIAVYEQVLQSHPDNKYLYKELIRLKTKRMDQSKATKEIDTLLKVPSFAKNEHLYIQQAENYKKQKKYEEAIESYRKGLKSSPDNMFMKKQIGYCYNKLNRYEDVIAFMREPFLLEPTDYLLRRTLFAAYRKTDRKEELIELIEGMDISGTSLYYSLMNDAKR